MRMISLITSKGSLHHNHTQSKHARQLVGFSGETEVVLVSLYLIHCWFLQDSGPESTFSNGLTQQARQSVKPIMICIKQQPP